MIILFREKKVTFIQHIFFIVKDLNDKHISRQERVNLELSSNSLNISNSQ